MPLLLATCQPRVFFSAGIRDWVSDILREMVRVKKGRGEQQPIHTHWKDAEKHLCCAKLFDQSLEKPAQWPSAAHIWPRLQPESRECVPAQRPSAPHIRRSIRPESGERASAQRPSAAHIRTYFRMRECAGPSRLRSSLSLFLAPGKLEQWLRSVSRVRDVGNFLRF